MNFLKKKSNRILLIAILFLILSVVSFFLMINNLRITSNSIGLSISYLEGDLYFSNNGDIWEIADKTILLTQGYRIRTGKNSRAEFRTPSGSFIRLSENSELQIGQISHRDALFTQLSGHAYYRIKPSRNNAHQIRALNHTIKTDAGAFDVSVNLKAGRINIKAIDETAELVTAENSQLISLGKEITFEHEPIDSDITNEYLLSDWFQWNKEMDKKYGFTVLLSGESVDQGDISDKNEVPETDTTPVSPTVKTPPASPPTTSAPSNYDSCKPFLTAKKDSAFKGVLLNWTTCPSDDFQFYKIIRSTLDSYPNYPNDPVISSSSNKNYSNYIDQNVIRSRTYYYRACVVERLNNISCGNVVSLVY